jgi:hypothetical protein
MGHRALTLWLVALALMMKVAVPSGWMIASSAESITIQLCSGYAPQQRAMTMAGMVHHPEKKSDHGKPELPCAYSGLTAPTLAGAAPVLLASAIVFITATVFRVAVDPAPAAAWPYIRPPLRGPPQSL